MNYLINVKKTEIKPVNVKHKPMELKDLTVFNTVKMSDVYGNFYF